MTEAERMYLEVTGIEADNETKKAVGLVWAIEQAGSLLERVKVAREALESVRK